VFAHRERGAIHQCPRGIDQQVIGEAGGESEHADGQNAGDSPPDGGDFQGEQTQRKRGEGQSEA
jgi:hypothetical protein